MLAQAMSSTMPVTAIVDGLGHLHRQLACRHEDQRAGAATRQRAHGRQTVQQRQRERRRLARARTRLPHQIAAGQQDRNRLPLDGRRFFVAERRHRGNQRRRQAKRGKAGRFMHEGLLFRQGPARSGRAGPVSGYGQALRGPGLITGIPLTSRDPRHADYHRSWTVGAAAPVVASPVKAAFAASTQTERPIGGQDVVYVATTEPGDRVFDITWQLNGQVVPEAAGRRTFALGPRKLPPGTHSLSATVSDPRATSAAGETRTWTIDNTGPGVTYTLASPVHSVPGPGDERHYFVRDEFTMKLDPSDDQPGYVVAEFRVNGDGWHHYYGWPDAPPGTPYKFTPRGTNIKELIYGSLSSEGLSPQPWEPREPGWGTHRIECRRIDAAGNIGAARAFRVTFEEGLACSATVTGRHEGDLAVTSGVTCLAAGATVAGNVVVSAGASFVATSARVTGSVTASNAAVIEIAGGAIEGSVRLTGTTGRVTIFGLAVGADMAVDDSTTVRAPTLVGNRVTGAMNCAGNSLAPTNGGTPGTAGRWRTQCGLRDHPQRPVARSTAGIRRRGRDEPTCP
jgi:hypothetical protein